MEFIENINEICDGFERIILRRIQPFEVDFSIENVRMLREGLKEKGYVCLRLLGERGSLDFPLRKMAAAQGEGREGSRAD